MISGRYRFTDGRGRPRPAASERAAAARQLGPRPQPPARPARQPADGRWSTAAPSPTPASTPPTPASGVRIGELDEEFIYERRVGDAFLLGTNAWRLDKHRGRPRHRRAGRGAAGAWSRSGAARAAAAATTSAVAIGAFLRELLARHRRARLPRLAAWREHFLDRHAARSPAPPRHAAVPRGRLPADRPAPSSSRRRATSSATGR